MTQGVLLDQFIDNKELGKDSFKNFKQVLEFCNKETVDGLMLLGDTYTSSNPSNTAVATSLNYLKKYTQVNIGEKRKIEMITEGIQDPTSD
jgi:DNA repair exonuclease SbcCD nuclease subunit